MKRIAAIGAVVTIFAVTPSVASAGMFAPALQPRISAQVTGVQTWNVRRAQAAVSVQRHLVQVAQSKRITTALRGQLR
jgi:hypothetical protein